MTISLGAVLGGPDSTPAIAVLRRMTTSFKKQRDEGRPFLNVVFHYPGSLTKPPYQGIRTGKFSKAEQGFMIQASVPEVVAQSQDEQAIAQYMLSTIREAVELSRSRWAKHGIAFPFEASARSIDAVAREFGCAVT